MEDDSPDAQDEGRSFWSGLRGFLFGDDSEAGKTRDAWAKREEALKKIVPHDRDRPVITGQDPNTDVIAKETAHQAEELRKSPPGTDYDGEKVVPPTPAPDNTPAPTPDPSSNGNGAAPLKRHPLSGPVFNTEVDRRFWAQNPEKAGQRLATTRVRTGSSPLYGDRPVPSSKCRTSKLYCRPRESRNSSAFWKRR